MDPASTKEEFRALCDAGEAPFIRSMSDWKEAVAAAKEGGTWRFAASSNAGVLSRLSDEALKQWEDSVEFRNGGLAHGHYALIHKELGDEGVTEFLRILGIDDGLSTDYTDYKCDGPGTCISSLLHICTGNC